MPIRSLLRFRLRTLFILLAAAAVLAASVRRVYDRYHAEQEALRQLMSCRFAVTTRVERPWWIPVAVNRRLMQVLDRVVYLSVAGQSVDWERGLSLHPRDFRDEHVRLLSAFRSLECLDLSSTQISSKSIDDLARLPSLRALDIKGAQVGPTAIREFKRRRPDCLLCDSRSIIVGLVHPDETVTINQKRCSLKDAGPLLTHARQGHDTFGHLPTLVIVADDDLEASQRARSLDQLLSIASKAGYQRIHLQGFDRRR